MGDFVRMGQNNCVSSLWHAANQVNDSGKTDEIDIPDHGLGWEETRELCSGFTCFFVLMPYTNGLETNIEYFPCSLGFS